MSASDPIEFAVAGAPAPQGSKSAYVDRSGRAHLLEGRTCGQRTKFRSWRALVAGDAMHALRRSGRYTPILGPVAVDLLFVHTRPASTPRGQRWRTKSPDVDKLARAVLDALVAGGMIGDDRQVADLRARKVLAVAGEAQGVVVAVTPLDHIDGPASVADQLPGPP